MSKFHGGRRARKRTLEWRSQFRGLVAIKHTVITSRHQHQKSTKKKTVFIRLLDHFAQELQTRFSGRFKEVSAFEGLIFSQLDEFDTDDILNAAKFYDSDLADICTREIRPELAIWQAKRQEELVCLMDCKKRSSIFKRFTSFHEAFVLFQQKNPTSAVGALQNCHDDFFPNLQTLLQLFATLPITTASVERSFSVLRILKTHLRSIMSEDRLNALALPNIYKQIKIAIDDVTEIFAPQKFELLDWEH